MSGTLIIGAGGVGGVVAHKCAQHREELGAIHLYSRTPERCRSIAGAIEGEIGTGRVDAGNAEAVEALIARCRARVVINAASPYRNLSIMEACARAGAHYVDTSLYDTPEQAPYEYDAQWAFGDRFARKGATAILSIGFDPGVVNVYCAHAARHLFDALESIDIIDCNAGSTDREFSTNFDPETNIREILHEPIVYEEGRFVRRKPLDISRCFDFPGIGEREAFLMAHEEVLSLGRFIPGVRHVRFWMAFTEKYLRHLRVLDDVGMTSIEPVEHEGREVVPLQFLKTLLPDPASLAAESRGTTCIGCLFEGTREGKPARALVYNNCRHEDCYEEVGSQAVSYTTGVPAVLAARLILSGAWSRPGVWNPEQMDPDPFMEAIGPMGLPWHVRVP